MAPSSLTLLASLRSLKDGGLPTAFGNGLTGPVRAERFPLQDVSVTEQEFGHLVFVLAG